MAVVAVACPHLFSTSRHPVAVELRGERTRGMTVVDLRPQADIDADPPHIVPSRNDVVWAAHQAQAVIDLVVQSVTSPQLRRRGESEPRAQAPPGGH